MRICEHMCLGVLEYPYSAKPMLECKLQDKAVSVCEHTELKTAIEKLCNEYITCEYYGKVEEKVE